MAIDRMKKITAVCPVHAAHRLNRTLYELCAVEIVNAVQTYGEAGDGFRQYDISTEECDRQLSKINLCLALIDEFAPEQKGFFEGLTPLPLLVESKELNDALHSFHLDAIYEEVRALDDARKGAQRRLAARSVYACFSARCPPNRRRRCAGVRI